MSYAPVQVPAITEQKVLSVAPEARERAVAVIEKWRDSVPSGASVLLHKVYCFDGCGCSVDGALRGSWSVKCAGGPFVPLEILISTAFPPDGSGCAVEGVRGVLDDDPVSELAFGRRMYLTKD